MSSILFTLAVPERSGAPRMGLSYASEFLRAGHSVCLAHGPEPLSGSYLPEWRAAGVETELIPELSSPLGPSAANKIATIVRKRKLDAVLSLQMRDAVPALSGASKAGVPGLVFAQTLHVFRGLPIIRGLKAWYYAQALRRQADFVIGNSPAVQKEVIQRFGVRAERTKAIYNGISIPELKQYSNSEKLTARKALGVKPEEFLFLNAGRFDPQKGLEYLLDAFARMSSCVSHARLAIVGGVMMGHGQKEQSDYREKLIQRANRLGLTSKICWAGWREDLPLLMSACDGYVHSALWEGPPLPLVMLEAMGAQKPVIGTDCSGYPEGFKNSREGWIVSKGSVYELAYAMEKLISLELKTRQKMGQSARILLEQRYSLNVTAPLFVEAVVNAILRSAPEQAAPIGPKSGVTLSCVSSKS